MSWNIEHLGTRTAVKAAVAKELYLPQGLKDVVASIADANQRPDIGLHVKSSGHIDLQLGGGVYNFEVKEVKLAQEPAAPANPETALAPP